MKKLIVLVLVAFILAGCGDSVEQAVEEVEQAVEEIVPTPTSIICGRQFPEYVEELDDLIERWDDANEIANSTPRGSLSGPLADLQEIKRDAGKVEAPECATYANFLLVAYMEKTIDSYLEFLGNPDDDSEVSKLIAESFDAQEEFFEEFAKLAE